MWLIVRWCIVVSRFAPLGAFYLGGNGERNTLSHTAAKNVFAVRTLGL